MVECGVLDPQLETFMPVIMTGIMCLMVWQVMIRRLQQMTTQTYEITLPGGGISGVTKVEIYGQQQSG